MAGTVRRPAVAVAPAVTGVNFGDLDFYSGGFSIPEGDYVIVDMTVKMYKFINAQGMETATPPVLGVVATLQSMAEPAAEFRTQFYSMGGNADKSFAPNPATGKGIVPVPGGPAAGMNNMTNWAVFLKSWYDSGLPAGIFTDDVSVFEGAHVHMAPTPEPLERKGFQSKTAEVQQQSTGPKTILTVTEIKDDGKPWEGTGGLLEAGVANPITAKQPVRPNGAAVRQTAPLRAAVVPVASPEEEVMIAASDAATAVLETPAYASGCTKLMLRTSSFKSVTAKLGADMAQAVVNTYYGQDEGPLNGLLGSLGYLVGNGQIKPL